ncbi:MAG: hypothetical protein IJ048_05920 [Clostridia bacterium]|nr:hypothetical protein [Clostridia bacterium]
MPNDSDAYAGRSFGCVFCLTGQEHLAARSLERDWDIVRARPVSVLKWRTDKGRKSLEPEVVFPSYVFFEADGDFEPHGRMPDGCLKVLKSSEDEWRLAGYDKWFAGWLLDQDGEIGLSKARRVGDRIQIQQGPLKDLEGCIVKVDKRGRSGQVKLDVNGRTLTVWLGFELLDDAKTLSAMALEEENAQRRAE